MSDNIVTPSNESVHNPDNPFDNLESLRLSQDFAANVGVKKAHTTVPVGKPNKQTFVRTHPEQEMRMAAAVVELKEEREMYIVTPDMCMELPGEIKPVMLVTTLTRQGNLSLWPIGLPGEDGKHNPWHRSAMDAADIASKQWVRVSANMSLGAYDTFIATGDLPEPEWPDLTFQQILKLAFRDHYINSLAHPVVKMLRGAS